VAGVGRIIGSKLRANSGIFTLTDSQQGFPVAVFNIAALIVGGGGSGGAYGGGGGGGGVAYASAKSINGSTNYAVVIGAGATATGANVTASTGSPSSVFGQTCGGGGDAGRYSDFDAGGGVNNGGQGAYKGTVTANGTAPTASSGFVVYGGYYGGIFSAAPGYCSGGGGGAGGNGGNSTTSVGGVGAAGILNNITGSNLYWAAGGGGSTYANSANGYAANAGAGGIGGGGGGGGGDSAGGGGGSAINSGAAGASCASGGKGGAGGANTGSGGGGSSWVPNNGQSGGNGGSGVVIFRYPNSYTISIGVGLTGTTAVDGSFRVTTITAGSGNVSFV